MTPTYQMIISVLIDKFGIVFLEDNPDDFAINDYLGDSLMFMQFIIAIEEEIGVELTDDFLNNDLLNSAKGFAEKIDFYMESLQGNADDPKI